MEVILADVASFFCQKVFGLKLLHKSDHSALKNVTLIFSLNLKKNIQWTSIHDCNINKNDQKATIKKTE